MRFEIERGIVEYYDLTCRYNFELSGDILSAIYDLESLKVGSVRKWDYYTQKTFYDVYKSVQDEVDEFNCGTSKRLNKTSCICLYLYMLHRCIIHNCQLRKNRQIIFFAHLTTFFFNRSF